MLGLPFERLHLTGQWRSVPKDRKVSAIGFDTETQDGLCKLLCSRDFACHPTNFDDCLDFLTRNAFRSKILCFFNLRYDIQAIFKWLPPEMWEDIYKTNLFEHGPYKIKWIPGKFLKVTKKTRKKRRSFVFFDCSQYYKGMTLDAAAGKYLGRGKLDHGADIAHLTDDDFQRADIIAYCMEDAALCEDLMNLFIKTCHRAGLYPTNFASPASISTRYFSSKVEIPTINSMIKRHPETLRIAWKTTAGAFICCYKRGYFPHIYEYDINSAYPFAMSNLPDLRGGVLVKQKGGPPESARLGWMECRVCLDKYAETWYHPPVCIKRPDNLNYFPLGDFRAFLTLNEYREYEKDFLIDPVGGLYWIPKDDPTYLYRDLIHDLYHIRKGVKDENLNYFYKIALNGFYGKSLEKHLERDPDNELYGLYRTGNFFNPFYASYILADTRIMVYRALRTLDPRSIVACFTDSIMTTEPLEGIPFGEDLGQWSYVQSGDLLMLGCGVYTLRDRDKIKSKLRGFHTTEKTNLFEEIKRFSHESEIRLSVRINFSMALALVQDRPGDMNKLIDTERVTDINFDKKRLWNGRFKKCGDLLEKQLDSIPYYHDILIR